MIADVKVYDNGDHISLVFWLPLRLTGNRSGMALDLRSINLSRRMPAARPQSRAT